MEYQTLLTGHTPQLQSMQVNVGALLQADGQLQPNGTGVANIDSSDTGPQTIVLDTQLEFLVCSSQTRHNCIQSLS